MPAFSYPDSLYDRFKSQWTKKKWRKEVVPVLPDREIVKNMIETAYHASFLTEERRRQWFRVVYISPEEIEGDKVEFPFEYIKIIKFNNPRIFNVNELLKLAPAADPAQVLIGVYNKGKTKELEIWGLIEEGTSWWDFTSHESSGGSPPPNAFTISSRRPGQISISRQGEVVLELEQGKIVESLANIFSIGPVVNFLERGQQELYREVCEKLGTECWDQEGDDDYPQRDYIFFLERILNRIREKHHGGTLIMMPDNVTISDTRLKDRINIKYPCHYNSAWEALVYELTTHNIYYDLHFKLWDEKNITNEEYQRCSVEDMNLQEATQIVKYAAGFLASLSAVDGAIVMTNKFRLVGFGAEITATSPSLEKIKVINDFEKSVGEYIDIEHFGTRHRSAFRFCSSFEDSLAFIVSQDGDIKIAKREGSEVLLWPNIKIGSLGSI